MITTPKEANEFWEVLKKADEAGFYMGGGTRGVGNDLNSCGTVNKHAYVIVSVFELKWNNHTDRMLLMRNPWGVASYNMSWNGNDTRWNNETVK